MAAKAGSRARRRARAPIGSPPGTLIPDHTASPTTMTMTLISDERARRVENVGIGEVREAAEGHDRLWLDVAGLSDQDVLSELGQIFSIDPLALEDIVNTHQRPKAEAYNDHALIVVEMFSTSEIASKEQFSIHLGKRHVVTFQEWPGDCLDPVRKRLSASASPMRKRSAAYLAYAMLDTIIDAYFPLLENIGDRLEGLEDRITERAEPANVKELHHLKRELLMVKRTLWPTREMLSGLIRGDIELVPKDIHQYLRDLNDHCVQLIDINESYRELSSNLVQLYESSVSARMNEIMKVLTIVSTIFIPLSFMAGVWGMNFDPSSSPWNMPELGAYYGYPGALITMAIVGIGLATYFWWKNWL